MHLASVMKSILSVLSRNPRCTTVRLAGRPLGRTVASWYHLSNGSLFFFTEAANACRQVHAIVTLGSAHLLQLQKHEGNAHVYRSQRLLHTISVMKMWQCSLVTELMRLGEGGGWDFSRLSVVTLWSMHVYWPVFFRVINLLLRRNRWWESSIVKSGPRNGLRLFSVKQFNAVAANWWRKESPGKLRGIPAGNVECMRLCHLSDRTPESEKWPQGFVYNLDFCVYRKQASWAQKPIAEHKSFSIGVCKAAMEEALFTSIFWFRNHSKMPSCNLKGASKFAINHTRRHIAYKCSVSQIASLILNILVRRERSR